MLYDGTCGFCAASVQFVLRHEHDHRLCFAALQSTFGQAVIGRHRQLRGVDSVVWVESRRHGECVTVRSNAALRVASHLGGWWRVFLLGRLLPRGLRDRIYNCLARNRHRLPGFTQQCLLVTPALRSRFLN